LPWSLVLQNSSCLAVYEILTALEPALPEEEIQKYVHWTQLQFRVFKNVDCFMSLHRRYWDKAVTLLFRNSTMQCYKGNVGYCLLQNNHIRDLQWQRLIFIGFNAEYLWCKGVCHDSQTDHLDAPLFIIFLTTCIYILNNYREHVGKNRIGLCILDSI